MGRLKVIFLTYCYPPQKYPRSVQISHLAQYIQTEFPLMVITSRPSGAGDQSLLSFTPLDNVQYAEKSALTQWIENAKGHRFKKQILPDAAYPWHFDLYRKTAPIVGAGDVDVIVTFGQPMSTHIAGLKLKRQFPHLKWVAHFSDPWVDNLFNEYSSLIRSANQYYQDAVCQLADHLIFTSSETVDLVMQSYGAEIRAKTRVFPHSFDAGLYPTPQEKPHKDGGLMVRYVGNFYGPRQPHFLFEALRYLPKSDLVGLRIELIGAATTAVEEAIHAYDLEQTVVTKPPVSYLESLALMQGADLLLIIDAPMSISPFLPSKLIDYIGSNTPMFGIAPPGASQKLIEEMGFLVASPEKPIDIAEKFSQMIRALKTKIITQIPSHIRNRYEIQTVGRQMADILKA